MDDAEPAESEGQRQVRGLLEGLMVALLGVGVSLAFPGAGGAVAAAATGSLLPAWEIVCYWARERVERTVADGVDLAGQTPEGFTAWVSADARHQGLLLAVVDAAARSRSEAQLDGLAQVLADGCRDDARVDVDTLIARALGDIGPAHLQVLDHLPRESWGPSAEGEQYSPAALSEAMPHLSEGMYALTAVLISHGCIEVVANTYGGRPTGYHLTPFGIACLDYLRKRRLSAAPSPSE